MRIPTFFVPVILLLSLVAGVLLAFRVPFPTFVRDFERPGMTPSGQRARIDLIVQNLRCRSRSGMLGSYLANDPGVLRLETYVGEMRARIVFDPAHTSLASITRWTHSEIVVPTTMTATAAELTDDPIPAGTRRVRPFTVKRVVETVRLN